MKKMKTRRNNIRNNIKNNTRNKRKISGGAALSNRVDVDPERFYLLVDLTEEVIRILLRVKNFPATEDNVKKLLSIPHQVKQINLLTAAKISKLNDHSQEAENKKHVIQYIIDDQAKEARRLGMPQLNITMEDIERQTNDCENQLCEIEETEFLNDFDPKKIKAIIRQFVEVNNIH